MAKTKADAKAKPETLIAYKAFDADMSCRGFKYEVGKTYTHDGPVSMYNAGFHACAVPFDCWDYYAGSMTFARVEMQGVSKETSDDSKRVGTSITISASLALPEWIKAQVEAVVAACRLAAGALADSGHAAATGYRGHAAYDDEINLVAVRSSLVGENGVEAGKTYRLTVEGEFEECGK